MSTTKGLYPEAYNHARDHAPLVEWRLWRGLSQHDLAREARVHAMTVSRAERGIRKPHPRSRRRIAEVLGVRLMQISEFRPAHLDAPAAAPVGRPLVEVLMTEEEEEARARARRDAR